MKRDGAVFVRGTRKPEHKVEETTYHRGIESINAHKRIESAWCRKHGGIVYESERAYKGNGWYALTLVYVS